MHGGIRCANGAAPAKSRPVPRAGRARVRTHTASRCRHSIFDAALSHGREVKIFNEDNNGMPARQQDAVRFQLRNKRVNEAFLHPVALTKGVERRPAHREDIHRIAPHLL